MFIFPDYVSTFTSEYTIKEAIKKVTNSDLMWENGVELISRDENTMQHFIVKSKSKLFRSFLPTFDMDFSEKTDGTLVYVRLDAPKSGRIFVSVFLILLAVLVVSLFVLMAMGKILWFIPFIALFCLWGIYRLINRMWAKNSCIKNLKKICRVLGYTPPKVMIIRVFEK